jgi:hypothetical protein
VSEVVEITKNEAYERLAKLTSRMDVPSYNVKKAQWLSKNLETRNKNHPNYKEAIELVELILRRGW